MPYRDIETETNHLKALADQITHYKNKGLHQSEYRLILKFLQTCILPINRSRLWQVLQQLIACAEKLNDINKLIYAYEYVLRLRPPEIQYLKTVVSYVEVLVSGEQFEKAKVMLKQIIAKYDDTNFDLLKSYVRICSKLCQFEQGLSEIKKYQTEAGTNKNTVSLCLWKFLLHFNLANYQQSLIYCNEGAKVSQTRSRQLFLTKKLKTLVLVKDYYGCLQTSGILLFNGFDLSKQKKQQIGLLKSYCLFKLGKSEELQIVLDEATNLNPQCLMHNLSRQLILSLPDHKIASDKLKQAINEVLKKMNKCQQLQLKKDDIVKYFHNLPHMKVFSNHLQFLHDNLEEICANNQKMKEYSQLMLSFMFEGYTGSMRVAEKLDQFRTQFLNKEKIDLQTQRTVAQAQDLNQIHQQIPINSSA